MKNNKEYIKWGLTAFFVILGAFASYYVIFHLDSLSAALNNIFVILMPVIDGLILAYLLTPLVNATERTILKPIYKALKIEGKKSQRRFLSIIVTVVVVLWALYGFFSIVIPQIYNSIRTIIEQFPSYINTLSTWISELLNDNPAIEKNVVDLINKYSIDLEDFINSKLIPQLNSVIMAISMSAYSVFKEFWNLIIGFIISIYVLGSKELFAAQGKKIVYAFLPIDSANRFISNVRFANKTFGGFFVGKILDSIIIGIICFIVTSILGTPFSVLISLIIGVTNIIPFFGPFLGAIPSILLILFIDPLQAVYFLIFVIILQQLDGNFIGPKILGSSTGLSSFWVIFAITLFGGIWGIFGMIVGVPIFAILFAFTKSLVESRLASRDLPQDTSKYLRLLYIYDKSKSKEFVEFPHNAKKPIPQISKIVVKEREKKIHADENENKPSKDSDEKKGDSKDHLE